MTLDDLQASLAGLKISIDIGQLFASFSKETGSEDIPSFLNYLHNRSIISDEAFRMLQPEDSVHIRLPGAAETSPMVLLHPPPPPGAPPDPLAAVDAEAASIHHKILGELGKGAAGTVYLARDLELRRKVAYKRIQPHAMNDRFILSHFLSEVQITAQLDHPNIVPVYAMYEASDGTPSYTMKFVKGKTLFALIAECRALYLQGAEIDDAHSLTRRLEYFLNVCDAVAYAHSKGVIHRDLKPENIMIGTFNQVYLMDWGIAKVLKKNRDKAGLSPAELKEQLQLVDRKGTDLDVAATQMGAVVGSVRYMSPEQASCDNDAVDEKSDQYALGSILFELISMKPSVEGESFFDILTRVGSGQLNPLEHVAKNIRIPQELKAIVFRATALEKEHRYANVSELADDLKRYMRGEAIRAYPETLLRRIFRWMQHNRETSAALLLFVALLFTAIASVSVIQGLKHQKEAANTRRVAAEEKRATAERARVREQRLDEFLSQVAEGRHRLDSHFLMVESLLNALAGSAAEAIAHGAPSGERLFSHLDYTLGHGPVDYAVASHYHRAVSFEWTVFKLAPGVKRAQVQPILKRMAHLRHRMKELFLSALGETAPLPNDTTGVREQLGVKGGPIFWAFVGLKQGVMFSYPGKAGYPADYDPRDRPWYVLAEGKKGIFWGNSYVDAMGGGLLLPSATSLYDEQDRFLGVAGMECTFDYIIENLMSHPEIPAIEEAFIVDDQARVVVKSSDKDLEFEAGHLHKALTLPPFPVPEVAMRIKSGQSGVVEVVRQGQPKLIAHYPLTSLGWHYVVQADVSALQ